MWTSWRIPDWLIGGKGERGGDFEDLRRRLEGEGRGAGSATDAAEGEVRRRGLGNGILDQFRGTL